jgi:transposase InsO family protein
MFEEHGIPCKLVTGNDTQYTASTFQEFANLYGFEYVTTSPYYSQANGFIERNVQTVKGLLQKCKESGPSSRNAMLANHTY